MKALFFVILCASNVLFSMEYLKFLLGTPTEIEMIAALSVPTPGLGVLVALLTIIASVFMWVLYDSEYYKFSFIMLILGISCLILNLFAMKELKYITEDLSAQCKIVVKRSTDKKMKTYCAKYLAEED